MPVGSIELPEKFYTQMPWEEVDSSNIKRMYYIEKHKMLYIDFIKTTVDGKSAEAEVYAYSDVSPAEYAALKSAPSVGKQFWATIRDKKRTSKVLFKKTGEMSYYKKKDKGAGGKVVKVKR